MTYLQELLIRLEKESISENEHDRTLAFGELIGMQVAFFMSNDNAKMKELEKVITRVQKARELQ